MTNLVGLVRAMAVAATTIVVVIFSRGITTASATVMLSTTGESEKDRDDNGLENPRLPLPSRSSSSSGGGGNDPQVGAVRIALDGALDGGLFTACYGSPLRARSFRTRTFPASVKSRRIGSWRKAPVSSS
mmetsp:Transcript_18961/g.44023  ORF Transcript_18961/g.44023 Transcript_18961/m.44023 type:complete len:130 (+) Transcript_18961:307-696(+)